MKLRIIVGMALMMLLTSMSQAKSWQGITPLKSTRADVERLLGKPNSLGRYQFENERASIHYKEISCDRSDDCACLVPKDTVLHIFVTIEVEMKFSRLKIDGTKYKRRRDTHLLTFVSYSNEHDGIVYTVAEDEVTDITYLPSAKDCREVVQRNRQAKRTIQSRCMRQGQRGSWNRDTLHKCFTGGSKGLASDFTHPDQLNATPPIKSLDWLLVAGVGSKWAWLRL